MKVSIKQLRDRWKTPAGEIARRAIEGALRNGASVDELKDYVRRLPLIDDTGDALDLRGIELPGLMTVKKTDLSGTRFDHAKINWNFAGSKLTGCVFDGASGLNVDFGGCDLRNSSFVTAKLPGAIYYLAKLEGAKLHGVRIKGGQLKGADCRRADFSDADLRLVWMAEADLSSANLIAANLVGASLGNCTWDDHTRFDHAEMSVEGTPATLYQYALRQDARFTSERVEWQSSLIDSTMVLLKASGHINKPLLERLQQLRSEVETDPQLPWTKMIENEFNAQTVEGFREVLRKAASNIGLSG